MKTIGETGDGFIVHITTDELASLQGNISRYSISKDLMKVGAEASISDIFVRAAKIVSAYEQIKGDMEKQRVAMHTLSSALKRAELP